MEGVGSQKRTQEEVGDSGRRVRKCEHCRSIHKACKPPPNSNLLKDDEPCKRCFRGGRPCGPKVFPPKPQQATRPRRRPRRADPPTAPPALPSSLTLTSASRSESNILQPALPTPQSSNPWRAASNPSSYPAGSVTSLQHADPYIEPAGQSTTDNADAQLNDLTELFILLECAKKASASIGPLGHLQHEVHRFQEDVDGFAITLGRKANKILGAIETLISTSKDVQRAENLCYKTMDLVNLYGEYTGKIRWRDERTATLLRMLISIYRSQNLWIQIHPVLRRLQQIPDITLTSDEQSWFAKSYVETSANMRPLLSKHGFDVNEDQTFCCETPFPAVNRAVSDGNCGTVQELLDQHPYTAPETDIIKRQPIHIAAASYSPLLLHIVIKKYGREINARDLFQRTPGHYAGYFGGLESFKIVHSAGIKLDSRDLFGHSILTYAAGMQPSVVRHMVEDLKVNLSDDPFGYGISPLHRAAENNQLSTIEFLKQHNAPDYALNSDGKTAYGGMTAYQIAEEKGFEDCAKALAPDALRSNAVENTPLVSDEVEQPSVGAFDTYTGLPTSDFLPQNAFLPGHIPESANSSTHNNLGGFQSPSINAFQAFPTSSTQEYAHWPGSHPNASQQ